MNKFQRFAINADGRDFAVGDVHGYFTKLQAALEAVGFNPAVDRLFSVGDLVDRGPESEQVLKWLDKPWFHAVPGNHEDMAVCYAEQTLRDDLYLQNGGAWLTAKNRDEKAEYAVTLRDLPVAIEVETAEGLVGIVHADCPFLSWSTLRDALSGRLSGLRNVEASCQWSRSRIDTENQEGVSGVRAVIVGHRPTRQPAVLGNVYHIDTGAWMGGHFTLIDLATLQCHPPINPKLNWDWEDRP
ncbi:metallophosphoesterase [Pseudomonas sp. NFACC37-1]|uniref:metallophosphoesterase n=1 Tax=Pseudomonas sp. NFACC37-1 TaxID=1566196 RepID=UPI000880FB9D|nr:metallophosphoesterase [Pseudomonas sp. NFACC37-1]SCZ13206.1 serine/threonine protein phosphatase 1 [Pseudomonas sp. NFACC37-1]